MNNNQWNMLQHIKVQRFNKAFLQPSSLEQELEEFY